MTQLPLSIARNGLSPSTRMAISHDAILEKTMLAQVISYQWPLLLFLLK